MHQSICVDRNPVDENLDSPMIDTPFFNWLVHHPNTPSIFHDALVEYLVGPGYRLSMLWGEFKDSPDSLQEYKYIFQHYWHIRLKLDDELRKECLHDFQREVMPTRPKSIPGINSWTHGFQTSVQ